MFYHDPNAAFRLLGVFRTDRKSCATGTEQGRKHTALGFRICGTSTFYSCGTELKAGPGSVVYIPPAVPFRRSSSAESLIVVHLENCGSPGSAIEVVPNGQFLEPYFQKLLEAWETPAEDSYNRCMALLYSIFQQLQRSDKSHRPPVPPILAPGVAMLQSRYRDSALTVAAMAGACFISQTYFRKLYAAHFGRSPQQALLELRFRYAGSLLRSGYYTQREIAALAGFSDVKYFRTAFKKYFGMTPGEYAAAEKE